MTEGELIEVDDERLIEGPVLTPKELAFCEAFANPESATFGSARKSAEAAGYREPHNAGWKLRRRPHIIAKLREYHAAVTVAVGRVLADLENERRLAVEKGDLATAVRASELMGKHLGMFIERGMMTLNDLGRIREYTEAERVEAGRLARLLLMGQPPPLLEGPSAPAALASDGQAPQEPQARQKSE